MCMRRIAGNIRGSNCIFVVFSIHKTDVQSTSMFSRHKSPDPQIHESFIIPFIQYYTVYWEKVLFGLLKLEATEKNLNSL